MPKQKTSLEKLLTGARFEGVKPNIPIYRPSGSKKLMHRLHEDDVELEKFIGAILGAIASAAGSAASAAGAAAGAVGSAAGAAGGAVARGASAAGSAAARGAGVVGRGAARGAKSDVGQAVGQGAMDAAMEGGRDPTAPPVEEPEDEMEAETQEAPQETAQPSKPTKRDKAVADIQALFSKSAEYTSNRQAPEYPPRASLGRQRIDWKKKEHGEPTSSIEKEGDGAGAGAGAGVGGTVFTSSNAGIFTPTHGGSSSPRKEKDRKKPKSTGIERLGRFLTDGSPLPLKHIEKSPTFNLVELLDEVRLDLRKEKKQVPPASSPIEDDPPQMVERYNPPNEAQEPKEYIRVSQSETEIKRDKLIDENKRRNNEPQILNLQQWGSGRVETDELKRGGKKDILTPPPESDEEERDTTIPEDPDLKVVGTEGYEKYLKYLRQMEKEGDTFPLMNAFWKALDDTD